MTVLFEATKLSSKSSKKGILTPDAAGYYTIVAGGLNALNSTNIYYTLQGAKDLFDLSAAFTRRIENGVVYAEVEHPKRTAKMTDDEYMERLLFIDRKNSCGHIRRVWLDESYGKNNPHLGNPNLVAIMIEIKPMGPHASLLKEALDNGDSNVCFSIRAFCDQFFANGRKTRVLETVVTFDMVLEGGIPIASKWDTPTLETISEKTVTQTMVKRFLDKCVNSNVALEDSKELALEVMSKCFTSKKEVKEPAIYGW